MSPEQLRAAQEVNQQRIREYQRAGVLPQSLSDLQPDTDDGFYVYDSTGVQIYSPSTTTTTSTSATTVDVNIETSFAYDSISNRMERDDDIESTLPITLIAHGKTPDEIDSHL
jgi:type II secretory pathway pseudopilin PulG